MPHLNFVQHRVQSKFTSNFITQIARAPQPNQLPDQIDSKMKIGFFATAIFLFVQADNCIPD